MSQMRCVETNRQLNSYPGNIFLLPVSKKGMEAHSLLLSFPSTAGHAVDFAFITSPMTLPSHNCFTFLGTYANLTKSLFNIISLAFSFVSSAKNMLNTFFRIYEGSKFFKITNIRNRSIA